MTWDGSTHIGLWVWNPGDNFSWRARKSWDGRRGSAGVEGSREQWPADQDNDHWWLKGWQTGLRPWALDCLGFHHLHEEKKHKGMGSSGATAELRFRDWRPRSQGTRVTWDGWPHMPFSPWPEWGVVSLLSVSTTCAQQMPCLEIVLLHSAENQLCSDGCSGIWGQVKSLGLYQALFWYLWYTVGGRQWQKRHSIAFLTFVFSPSRLSLPCLQEVQGDWSEWNSVCTLACFYTDKTPPKNLPSPTPLTPHPSHPPPPLHSQDLLSDLPPFPGQRTLPAQCLSPGWFPSIIFKVNNIGIVILYKDNQKHLCCCFSW